MNQEESNQFRSNAEDLAYKSIPPNIFDVNPNLPRVFANQHHNPRSSSNRQSIRQGLINIQDFYSERLRSKENEIANQQKEIKRLEEFENSIKQLHKKLGNFIANKDQQSNNDLMKLTQFFKDLSIEWKDVSVTQNLQNIYQELQNNIYDNQIKQIQNQYDNIKYGINTLSNLNTQFKLKCQSKDKFFVLQELKQHNKQLKHISLKLKELVENIQDFNQLITNHKGQIDTLILSINSDQDIENQQKPKKIKFQELNCIVQEEYINPLRQPILDQEFIETQQTSKQNFTQQLKEDYTKVQVCFLIDTRKSINHCKQQLIHQCMKFHQMNDIQTEFAVFCFGNSNQTIHQNYHNFTNDFIQITKYVQSIESSKEINGDGNICNALQQMLSQLSWKQVFKLGIIICGSEEHRRTVQKNNLESIIESMITKQIMLVTFQDGDKQNILFNEIRQIYEEKGRSFLYNFQMRRSKIMQNCDFIQYNQPASIVNFNKEFSKFVEKIQKSSSQGQRGNSFENIILEFCRSDFQDRSIINLQLNENETCDLLHSVIENSILTLYKYRSLGIIKLNDYCAIEANCKVGNIYDFDMNIQRNIIQSNFKVYSASLNDQSFSNNFQNIGKLKYLQDYQVKPEGIWNCIRTQSIIALAMRKDVHLMKRINVAVQDLYILKAPLGRQSYQSLEEAVNDCQAQLIGQSLMRMFIEDINKACQIKQVTFNFPSIKYSDLLILEESPSSFWIAERFYKGEFVKYNTSFGYISEDKSIMNQMALAFSYYTYFKSNFKYLITNVQGVGTYFTDPAITTIEGIKGDFDEHYMGQDGQHCFLVNYKQKKGICSHIIKGLLEIDDDLII